MSERLKIVNELLRKLIANKFYGSITFKFESGNIVHCKKEESIKFHDPVMELKSVLENFI